MTIQTERVPNAGSLAAAPDRPLNWSTAFVMLSGGLMVSITLSALTPVLPDIEAALARSATDKLLVKMLVSIVGVTMVIGAPLTGYLFDRVGARKLLVIHSLMYAVGGTAGFYLSDLNALLISRLFVGLGAAGMATISMTLINTQLDGNARAKWMGFHISAAMFGSLLILPALGALGEIGWRWPFLAYAASLSFTIAAFSVRQARRPSSVETEHPAPVKLENPLKWFPLWFLPLALLMGSVTYLPSVYLAFVARDVGVSSPSTISLVMLADVIIGATMALLFGRGQRYVSSNGAFIFSFTCTGVALSIVALSSSFTGVVIGMLIFGLGIGWFVPNLMIALSRRVAEHQQGPAVGIVKAAHYLASPLAILAVEPVFRLAGASGAMGFGAFLSFVVVTSFLFILVRQARPDRQLASASTAAE